MSEIEPLDRNPQLTQAFAQTRYLIGTAHRVFELRIGDRPPLALRRAVRGRPWAILTAYNPGARLASMRRNRAADRRLRQRLVRLQPRLLARSIHKDPTGRWPDEAGWLICPIGRERARRIGREFGQVAIVAAGWGGRAEILECGPPGRDGATGLGPEITAGAGS